MILERLTLENFRQYFGRQRVEFARDGERHVTVINGVNGYGKTSMFLAINWCLYGRQVENIKVVDNVGELISKEAVARAEVGSRVSTSVELYFIHESARYIVKRTLEGIKKPDNKVDLQQADTFTMMRIKASGQNETIDNPIGMMNSILPVTVREYFFFDGEKIDNFAKPEAAEQVKQAIQQVMKIELLNRARRHLDDIAQEYRRELKKTSAGKLKDLLDQEEKARQGLKSLEQEKEKTREEIDLARGKIKDIDQRLRELEGVKELQREREQYSSELEKAEQYLISTITQIRDLATTSPFMVGYESIVRANALLEEKRQRGEIPSNIRQQLLKDLLDQMRCICGRPIERDSPEYNQLLGLMENTMSSALEDDVLSTSVSLMYLTNQSAECKKRLAEAMQDRVSLTDEITGLRKKIDDVSRQLKGSPLEEASGLEEKRGEFRSDIESANVRLGELNQKIGQSNKQIEDLEREIKKEEKHEARHQLLSRKLELAQTAADKLTEARERYADDIRSRVEQRTKDIFKRLVWKQSHFQDVQLTSSFHLEVIDRWGKSARLELSAGERQVLSLSFIMAMSQEAGEEKPLVMDTPFGRLSAEHRNSITENLPKLVNQLVLFATNEELLDEARKNLEPYIGAEYRLEFDQQTSCTKICEVPR